MALICITDDPYKRDFYHWVLQGHCEGYDIPVDEGFEWKEEEGIPKIISIGYPKTLRKRFSKFLYDFPHLSDLFRPHRFALHIVC
ncbi:unnamed protein product [marine sediment metagenome]|uniref:Uncharacterized protein n=1 Tax=marine sediment metagenome TaxID=412755 RepID=X1L2Z3_9ZZZZ